jgi:hypothetical protein
VQASPGVIDVDLFSVVSVFIMASATLLGLGLLTRLMVVARKPDRLRPVPDVSRTDATLPQRSVVLATAASARNFVKSPGDQNAILSGGNPRSGCRAQRRLPRR